MSELSDAINEMRNMRESYGQLGAAAEAYNAGKSQLVENLNSKGVHASASETLPELADKVAQIAQTQTILDGGEVMAAQQFGDGALWNLYQVLADMKTRFIGSGDYAALIVCEYYKGYDSLQLQGADGYYTCDGDLYDYASTNHVWHDMENGKVNRWVAFLYRNAGARLDITNTAISPRSMYIGGHIGTIEYFVDGRLTELVSGVEETDVVDNFLNKNFNQAWGFNMVLRGVKKVSNLKTTSSGLLDVETPIGSTINDMLLTDNTTISFINIKGLKDITLAANQQFIKTGYYAAITEIIAEDLETITVHPNNIAFYFMNQLGASLIQRIYIPKFKSGNIARYNSGDLANLIDLHVGELETSQNLLFWTATNVLADATKKAQLIENIKNHILARVSDRTGLSQLVFTVSTNMYNAIASETIEWQGETMSLADVFLTKNWLLAGA